MRLWRNENHRTLQLSSQTSPVSQVVLSVLYFHPIRKVTDDGLGFPDNKLESAVGTWTNVPSCILRLVRSAGTPGHRNLASNSSNTEPRLQNRVLLAAFQTTFDALRVFELRSGELIRAYMQHKVSSNITWDVLEGFLVRPTEYSTVSIAMGVGVDSEGEALGPFSCPRWRVIERRRIKVSPCSSLGTRVEYPRGSGWVVNETLGLTLRLDMWTATPLCTRNRGVGGECVVFQRAASEPASWAVNMKQVISPSFPSMASQCVGSCLILAACESRGFDHIKFPPGERQAKGKRRVAGT